MFNAKNKTLHHGDASKVKQYWGTYTVLGISLGAMTFFGVCSPGSNSGGMGVSGNAAVVAGEKISQSEFRRAYRQQVEQLRNQYQEQYDPAILRPAQMVMEQLVRDRILYKSAVDMGLKSSQDEVVKYLTGASAFRDESGKFSQKNFENFLQYNNYSEASFLEEMQRSLTVQKLRSLVTSSTHTSSKAAQFDYRIAETKLDLEYLKFSPADIEVAISADEVKSFLADAENLKKAQAWYDSHGSDYKTPEKVHARHILIAFKGARSATGEAAKREKADAKKKADEIVAKLRQPGADFVELAKAETDEPSGKMSGGDLGYFAQDAMVKEFSDVAFKLPKGQISDPTESPFGYHIIRVEDKQDKKEISFDGAREDIAKKLLKTERAPKLLEAKANDVLAALKEKRPVDDLLKGANNISWKKTGEFSSNARTIPGLGASPDLQQSLLSLTMDKPLADKAHDIGGSYYIVRLASRKDADMTKLDDEKMEQLTSSDSYMQGYQFFSNLEKSLQKKYVDQNAIRKNQNYLELDKTESKQGG
jgi:peptidyl-prolyl cis-trans isomerase D